MIWTFIYAILIQGEPYLYRPQLGMINTPNLHNGPGEKDLHILG